MIPKGNGDAMNKSRKTLNFVHRMRNIIRTYAYHTFGVSNDTEQILQKNNIVIDYFTIMC